MKRLCDLRGSLHRVRGPVLAVVALALVGVAVGAWALLPVSAQQPQPIAIEVDGTTIWLEPGKNVHPETYEFLAQDPGPDWFANTIWKHLDGMWIPLARGCSCGAGADPKSLPKRPTAEVSPLSDPDCTWTRNVPVYRQDSLPWKEAYLFLHDGTRPPGYELCKKMYEEGCAITSTAMVFKYFGVSTDPGQLNTCLGNNDIHAGACGMAFDSAAISDDCDGSRVAWGGMWDFNIFDLCPMLALDRPPIVEVDSDPSTPATTHWVVVYRSLGLNPSSPSDYYVRDPWDGSSYKTLAHWPARLRTLEYYRQ